MYLTSKVISQRLVEVAMYARCAGFRSLAMAKMAMCKDYGQLCYGGRCVVKHSIGFTTASQLRFQRNLCVVRQIWHQALNSVPG